MTTPDMKKVTRYVCRWCKKEFHRPDLHDCKWKPEKRNCLSCVHECGDFSINERRDTEFGPCYDETKFFQCDLLGKNECDSCNNITDLAISNWKGCCDDYEMVHDYKGTVTFRERRKQREQRAVCKECEYGR